jgi:hypothetical protein
MKDLKIDGPTGIDLTINIIKSFALIMALFLLTSML